VQDFRTFQVRYPGHPKYQPDVVLIDNPVIHIIQKIEMLLFTNKGDFIGDLDLGCDLELLIWETNVSGDYIQNIVLEQFNTYIPELSLTNWTLSVDFVEGDFRDIAVINITVNDAEITTIFR
jgi:hypothetical protein